jgi:hypothetical protein
MPPPRRLDQMSIEGSTTCARAAQLISTDMTAAPAHAAADERNDSPDSHPMTQVPSLAHACACAPGEAEPDAKKRECRPSLRRNRHARLSWEKSGLTRPSHRHYRHRCERPLRMDAPSTGWVTALAGLLARGSLHLSGLPSCPVAISDERSPLTVAGAATDDRVRVPSFVPGSHRGTSTVPCSMAGGMESRGRVASMAQSGE